MKPKLMRKSKKINMRAKSSQCHADPEIVPDFLEKSEIYARSLNLDACIICEISDKSVSRCSGIDCLVSYHDKCLNTELDGNEDLTNPFCPYCWFKFVAKKYTSLKEKAIDAKKAVLKYLDKEDTILSADENGVQDHSMEKTDIVSDHVLQGENDKDNEIESLDEEAEDQTKGNTRAEKKSEPEQTQQNENRTSSRKRRRLIEVNSTDSEISPNESTQPITSSAQLASPSGKMKKQERKLEEVTKVSKSNTVRDVSFFNKDQKRRLLWTPEEEEMLKVGVEIYAAEANKNMPWRKILGMGEKVFHETRTPTDLKDKWRNMIGKLRTKN